MPCTLVSQIDQPIQHGLCDFFFVVRTVFWLHFSSGLLGIEREVGDIRFFCCCLKLFALINCVFLPEVSSLADIFSPNANCPCYLFQSHKTLFRILNVGDDSRNCPFLDISFRCSENSRPDMSYTKWRRPPTHRDFLRSVGSDLLLVVSKQHFYY